MGAVVGIVEELSTTPATRNLVRHQFEALFFTQVNFIKAALPTLRAQRTGHVIVLTSIGGHIGTPGMAMYTAATWALEGFCDSLAYEVAPFNVKVTIVQPNKEIQSLTNRLVFAPQMPAYTDVFDTTPSVRDMLVGVLNAHPDTAIPDAARRDATPPTPDNTSLESEPRPGAVFDRYLRLPPDAADQLVMETIHALTAIGVHENPPLEAHRRLRGGRRRQGEAEDGHRGDGGLCRGKPGRRHIRQRAQGRGEGRPAA